FPLLFQLLLSHILEILHQSNLLADVLLSHLLCKCRFHALVIINFVPVPGSVVAKNLPDVLGIGIGIILGAIIREGKQEKQEKPKVKKPPPPPVDFQSLLKLAEKKQFEPIEIVQEVKKKEPERPMTQKEKQEHEERLAIIEAKKKRMLEAKNRANGKIPKVTAPVASSSKVPPTPSTSRKPEPTREPKESKAVAEKRPQKPIKKEIEKPSGVRKDSGSVTKKPQERPKPPSEPQKTREFPPKDVQKTREFPPKDVQRPREIPRSRPEPQRPKLTKPPPKRLRIEDDDSEYDSEMDDFIREIFSEGNFSLVCLTLEALAACFSATQLLCPEVWALPLNWSFWGPQSRCYSTKFAPPKKEARDKKLSANIQKFLAKKEAEEREKEREKIRKRDELLAMRDTKSKNKINKMLKVIKSANKSVIADAVDNENTAVTLHGPDQPDEDDYGYVSQEASAFYSKMMEKYKSQPEEDKFSTGKRKVSLEVSRKVQKEPRDRNNPPKRQEMPPPPDRVPCPTTCPWITPLRKKFAK
uniref:SPT2 homolog N-terminal domain-containing protein n=1 Tax=Phlebotomus papatasi TaxID=29031 RepID=A0A1B0DBE8_PHLPP